MDDTGSSQPAANTAGTTNVASCARTFDDQADIADAVRGAQLLLSYAAERGLDLDPGVVKTIVESKHMLRSGQWSAEHEVGLWTALNSIAKAVKPVSVASLECMSDASPERAGVSAAGGPPRHISAARQALEQYRNRFFPSRHVSAAQKAVRRYRNRFFASLIVLLAIQMYWLVGASITSDFETIPKKVVELNSLIDKLKPGGTDAASRQIKDLETEKEYNFTQMGTRIEILQKWNSIWGPSAIFGAADSSGDSDHPEKANDRALLTAGFVLTAMRVYILPLLYGLVGACAYILRSLATEIEARTFSGGSETHYQLRFYLGALAGMAVGWFFTPDSSPALFKSISPFALAFLAGYSVDVLFAAMDRFIAAFASEKPAAPAEQQGDRH